MDIKTRKTSKSVKLKVDNNGTFRGKIVIVWNIIIGGWFRVGIVEDLYTIYNAVQSLSTDIICNIQRYQEFPGFCEPYTSDNTHLSVFSNFFLHVLSCNDHHKSCKKKLFLSRKCEKPIER